MKIKGIGMTSQRTRNRLVARLRTGGITNERVLEVLRRTPRHLFVDEALAHRAYEDTALPIGFNQTISQPFIVARMTELLLEQPELETVLEVGTGSGYQAAVLAQLVHSVYSVERIKELQDRARRRFFDLKLRNIRLRHSDGGEGWPEQGPYDGIVVTAAPPEIPSSLVAQLKPGGAMIIPVGNGTQELRRVTKTDEGYQSDTLSEVQFVPMQPGST